MGAEAQYNIRVKENSMKKKALHSKQPLKR